MGKREIDLDTWARAPQYRLFRGFERPHYATTARLDVSALMAAKADGLSPYRACIYAIGVGLHAVPELRTRFIDDVVTEHERLALSMTVPRADGAFGFGYVEFNPDFATFDPVCSAAIENARTGPIEPNRMEGNGLAYLSCMPWLDYTSITNAMPSSEDCIPRISWGKIMPKGDGFDMAMTIEVHHAIADGVHIGTYFEAVQMALNAF